MALFCQVDIQYLAVDAHKVKQPEEIDSGPINNLQTSPPYPFLFLQPYVFSNNKLYT